MYSLISRALSEVTPRNVTISVVDHIQACDLVVNIAGCGTIDGYDPRARARVYSNPDRAIRVPCDLALAELEDAILAYGWEAGAWDVVRYHTTGGYCQPGLGHLKSFGVPVYSTTVAGVAYPDQIGEADIALASDAARYGYWKWVMKPSRGLGTLSLHRARRDSTLRLDGSRDKWQGLAEWPQTRWLQIARRFKRSHGRNAGLQTIYILPRQRVEIFEVEFAETADWQQPDEHEVRG